MPDKEEYPLEYRRYTASAGQKFPLPPKTSQSEPAQDKEKTPLKDSPPPPPPRQLLKQLENKLSSTPLTKESLKDYMKLMNDFIKLGYDLEEYDLIINYMKTYLGRRPRDLGVRHSLAMTLVKIGEIKKAKIELRKILDFNPQYKPARNSLERLKSEGL